MNFSTSLDAPGFTLTWGAGVLGFSSTWGFLIKGIDPGIVVELNLHRRRGNEAFYSTISLSYCVLLKAKESLVKKTQEKFS